MMCFLILAFFCFFGVPSEILDGWTMISCKIASHILCIVLLGGVGVRRI